MRKGTWIIAVCGAGFAFAAGWANDEITYTGRVDESQPSAKESKVEYFSRSGRSSLQERLDEYSDDAADNEKPELARPRRPRRRLGNIDNIPRLERYREGEAEGEQPKVVRRKETLKATGPRKARTRKTLAGTNESNAASDKDSRPLRRLAFDEEDVRPARPEPRSLAIQQATHEADEAAPSGVIQVARSTELIAARPTQRLSVGASSPQLSVEWVRRSEMIVGQECRCQLVVKNTGSAAAAEVLVDAFFPKTIRMTDAKPRPREKNGKLTWALDALAPNSEKTIELRMIPSARGNMPLQASVRFSTLAKGQFFVEEPLLAVSIKGPQEVLAGDPATQIVAVSNPGTGIAHNVELEAVVPAGLEHPRGKSVKIEVGSLGPGESRNVRLGLAAIQGGKQLLQVHARAEGVFERSARAEIAVIAPSLKATIAGPGLRYLGRTAVYKVTVQNDGAAATSNVRVMHKIPEGFKFRRANNGGKLDPGSRTVSWFLGRIEPGQSSPVQIELEAVKDGMFTQEIRVMSEQGANTHVAAKTRVEGTASLVLEVADRDDPVEVGSEVAYEIRVRNDGSKAAQNVEIACELPKGVELISTDGPSDAAESDQPNLVVFEPLKLLPPGKSAVYQVITKGTGEGNRRFRARLSSDSIQEPLIDEELTKFYAD